MTDAQVWAVIVGSLALGWHAVNRLSAMVAGIAQLREEIRHQERAEHVQGNGR